MKAHKIELILIDRENYGADDCCSDIFNRLDGNVIFNRVKTADIGEWRDDHPLNLCSTTAEEIDKYFE